MKILIKDISYKIREGSVNVSDSFGERSTSSFMLITESIDNISFNKGESVKILDEMDTLIFSGVIDICKEKKLRDKKLHSIISVDFHYLIEKRIIAKGFEDMMAGEIAKYIVDNILSEEGITYSQESIHEGEVIRQVQFNYIYCNEALDKLAEKCGFIWYIDSNKVLHFHDPKVKLMNKTITSSMIRNDSLVIENKNQMYRNKQYVKGAKETTAIQTAIFKGDGKNKSFTLGYPLAKKPTIYVNEKKINFSDVVLKGYNNTASYYYNKNDAVIVQNNKAPALTESDELKVEYNGQFPVIAITEDIAEIEKRKGIESNSGKVENVSSEPQLDSLESVFQSANSKIRAYAKDTINIKFQTSETWFRAGMVVNIDTDEIKESDLLVQNVEFQDEFKLIWCSVTLVKGAINESWAKVFARSMTKDNTAVQEEMLQSETLVLLETYKKTWLFNDMPNIMKEVYISNNLFPSSTLFPMFNVNDRIKYVEIADSSDNVLLRKYITYKSEVSNQFITNFFISPHECNTQWKSLKFYGGIGANEKIGSGVLIEEVISNRNKTQLESIQIKRTDIRGW